MKKYSIWFVPGFLALTAFVAAPACSSSDDDPSGGNDATVDGGEDGAASADSGGDEDGDAAQGATDGSTSDSGQDGSVGDGGHVDPYVAACARIDACAAATTPKIGMNGCYALLTAEPFGRVLFAAERARIENLKCKLAATTCAGVRACDKPAADYTAFCQTAEGGEHCSGNVHVVCDDDTFAPVMANDCAAAGGVCGEANFQAGCGKAACDPETATSSCNGNVLSECTQWGVTRDTDCATANDIILIKPLGLRTIASTVCGDGFDGNKACVADGAECTGLNGRCDGTVLETCSMGKLARRDCSKVSPAGQGCVTLTDVPDRIQGALGCGPVNPACKTTDNETCDIATGVIGYCGLTEAKTVDCKALGYAGCKTTTVEGRVTAGCFQ